MDPAMTTKDRAWKIVDAVLTIADCIRGEREEIARELADGLERDGTPMAGHLADALIAAGGKIPGRNPHKLRHPINEGSCSPLKDPGGFVGATDLATLLLQSLEYARKMGPNAPHGEVEAAAEIWPFCATKAEAEAAVAARSGRQADGDASRVVAEHAARIKAALPHPPTVAEAAAAVVQAFSPKATIKKAIVRDPGPPKIPTGPGRPDGPWAAGEIFDLPPTVG